MDDVLESRQRHNGEICCIWQFFRFEDNVSLSKYLKVMNHKIALGLNVFNILDLRNPVDVYPMTGKPDDPGTYYTDYVGLPGTDPSGQGKYANKSSAYYDRPWRLSSPREINFFVRIDFD